MKFIEFFKNKGVLATIIGLIFAAPINVIIFLRFMKSIELSNEQLITAWALNLIGIVWFMLPSKIEIVSKLLTFKLED